MFSKIIKENGVPDILEFIEFSHKTISFNGRLFVL